jgi:hypothetical protein
MARNFWDDVISLVPRRPWARFLTVGGAIREYTEVSLPTKLILW